LVFQFNDIKQVKTLKKIGILYHPKVEATRVKAEGLRDFIVSQGVSAWMGSSWDKEPAEELMSGTDLLLTVGGDGTILRAAQIALDRQIPITGINLGKLGFLTELDAGEAMEKLPALLAGKGWIDERAMLQAEVVSGGEPRVYHALNDIAAARGEIARMVKIEASVDGQHLATYKADGLIIATATGSTGYALAAGGPIMHPQSGDFLMVAVAPHLCLDSPLVLPEKAEITLRADTYLPTTLSVDGHINRPLSGGVTLKIKRSPRTTRFRRIRPREYFYNILEEKLRGKQGESRKG
jgi:NAD+ kinase